MTRSGLLAASEIICLINEQCVVVLPVKPELKTYGEHSVSDSVIQTVAKQKNIKQIVSSRSCNTLQAWIILDTRCIHSLLKIVRCLYTFL